MAIVPPVAPVAPSPPAAPHIEFRGSAASNTDSAADNAAGKTEISDEQSTAQTKQAAAEGKTGTLSRTKTDEGKAGNEQTPAAANVNGKTRQSTPAAHQAQAQQEGQFSSWLGIDDTAAGSGRQSLQTNVHVPDTPTDYGEHGAFYWLTVITLIAILAGAVLYLILGKRGSSGELTKSDLDNGWNEAAEQNNKSKNAAATPDASRISTGRIDIQADAGITAEAQSKNGHFEVRI